MRLRVVEGVTRPVEVLVAVGFASVEVLKVGKVVTALVSKVILMGKVLSY